MDKLQDLYNKLDLDALIILSHANVLYYSGFSSSNAQIVITKTDKYFITDPRYYLEARNILNDSFTVVKGNFSDIKKIVEGCSEVGWDDNVSYYEFLEIKDLLIDKKLFPISKKILEQRESKSLDELNKIKAAQAITDKCFIEILPFIKEGVSEIEIAAKLEYLMLNKGAELAFDSIVAFGANASVPHWHRSETKLKQGDFVLMDFGAKYQHYCSDMTRTVCLGTPSQYNGDVYNKVLNAQLLAISKIKANMIGADCHNIAANYFKLSNDDQYFTHALGHGVGIDIHEGKNFSPRCLDPIKANSVMSVEPGLYIDGKVGVRIEDIVIVENSGVSVITQSNKNLIKL